MNRTLAAFFAVLAGAGHAQTLDFPSNAALQLEERSPLDSYAVPVDIWANDAVPIETVEGALLQQAWRIEAASLTTLQIMRPLREQLRNARFRIVFECQTEACGGFDFRFGTPTLPPPEMQINIGDFRFLTAERTTSSGPEYITLFVSRTAQAGFVQVTRIGAAQPEDEPVTTATAPIAQSPDTPAQADIPAQLEQAGARYWRILHLKLDRRSLRWELTIPSRRSRTICSNSRAALLRLLVIQILPVDWMAILPCQINVLGLFWNGWSATTG